MSRGGWFLTGDRLFPSPRKIQPRLFHGLPQCLPTGEIGGDWNQIGTKVSAAWARLPFEIGSAEPFLLKVSDGTRTRDRLDHNQELYQLSYAHRAGSNVAVVGGGPQRLPRQSSVG